MVLDGRLLKDRGAGIYQKSGSLNNKDVYKQEGGSNFIYYTGEYYAVGEQSETDGIIYESTGNRRIFLRSYNEEIQVNATHVSHCASDVGGWAIRIPFSTIWTYGHRAVIGCLRGEYRGTFDARSSGITYGPGGTSKG